MIYFNSVALENIAPVKIEDIRVSPITIRPVTRERAIRSGAELVRVRGAERSVVITFGLLTDDLSMRTAQLQNITNWAVSTEEKWLRLPNYDASARHLEAICTEYPSPSMRQWWDSRLRLVFTCFNNPYWTSDIEKSAACGASFTASGNAMDGPLMRIERTLSSAASSVSYSSGGQFMVFSTVPAGNLAIDLNRQTAAVNGTSIMQYWDIANSTFIKPKNGTQTINGTGTIKYRERWQ